MKNQIIFEKINAIIESKSMLTHPFYKCWQAGMLTKEELQSYLKQYQFVEGSFPRFFSAVHANCADATSRQVMLDNLNHEEQGSNNHVAQFERLAVQGLDIPAQELKNAKPNQATQSFVNTLSELTQDHNVLVGISAMIVYKQQIYAVAKTKMEGLQQLYKITDEQALEFYRTHAVENRDWHNMLDKHYSADQEAKVLAAVRQAADAFWKFLDGVTTPEINARCAA